MKIEVKMDDEETMSADKPLVPDQAQKVVPPDGPDEEPITWFQDEEEANDSAMASPGFDEAEDDIDPLDQNEDRVETPFSDEERDLLCLKAKTLKIGLIGQEILNFYVTEIPEVLRREWETPEFWERLSLKEEKAIVRLKELVDLLAKTEPPQPWESPEAVLENHRMRAREILRAELL